jgi:hypothetical protein
MGAFGKMQISVIAADGRPQPAVRDEIRKVGVDHVWEIFCLVFLSSFLHTRFKETVAHVNRHRQL